MIEKRFKDTEVGRIPVDWEVSTLKDICINITDGSHNSPKESAIGYYMPSVKDMTTNGFSFSDCKIISEKDFQRLVKNGCQPHKNDVLIAKDGSILKYSFAITKELPIVVLSSIAIIRPNIKIIKSKFLAAIFRQKKFIDEVLTNYKTGTGVPRIVLKNFAKIKLSYPSSIEEQNRIALTLSNIDLLISHLIKLIEKKRSIKQGTMQQLLTGKKRLKGFSEPWVEKKLGEIGTLTRQAVNPQSFPDTLFCEYSMPSFDNGKLPEYKLGQEMLSNRTVIDGKTLLYNKLNVRQKRIWLIEKCECNSVCSSEFLAFKSDEINLTFLKYFLSTNKVTQDFIDKSKGTSNSQKRIQPKDFLEYIIRFPNSDAEQSAIAYVLSSMDEEISALEAKREKYTAIKQGMMQQLLTGKIRLV